MYWAAKAGLATTEPYGYAPGKFSGHYARHLKPLLGSPDQISLTYEIVIRGHHKLDMERTVRCTPTIPPHEAVAEAMTSEYIQQARTSDALEQLPLA